MDIGPFGITHQTVGELRAALAELPDDAPVQVRRHRHRAPSRHSVLMFDATMLALVALILAADYLLGVTSEWLLHHWRHRH